MTAPSIKEALELKPCPFCGCEDIKFNHPNKEMGWRGSINCPACLVTMPRECDDQELIDRWNERAAIATFQPDGERREAIARAVRSVLMDGLESNDPGKWLVPMDAEDIGDLCEHAADTILASGLVQDEAGWRDISTAPKDGTEILLFTHHEADEYLDESFDAVQIGWWDDGNHAPGSVFHRDAGWHQQKIGSATHWMPLPTPPIRSARDEGRGAFTVGRR